MRPWHVIRQQRWTLSFISGVANVVWFSELYANPETLVAPWRLEWYGRIVLLAAATYFFVRALDHTARG